MDCNIKKEKILNFRAIFFCFVSFLCAIIFARQILQGNWIYISFFCVVFAIVLFFTTKYKCVKRAIATICAFLLGLAAFLICSCAFESKTYTSVCTVQGQIKTISSSAIILENVKINQENQRNMIVYTYANNFKVGQIIKFENQISKTDLFELDQFNSTAYKNWASYFCSVDSDDITILSIGNLSVAQKFQNHIKNIFVKYLPADDVGLFFGMLFGDKSMLDTDIKQSFQTSGLSHMLAVSGLHIGFLIMILNFLFDKFGAKRIVKCCFSFVFLLAYCWLCSFSPSVVRASIMAMTSLVCGLFGKQYDFVNSISLSGIIILLFSPLSAFDIGFQLSFLSVFSIAFIFPAISKFLKKIKCPKFLSDSFALTLCVQIGLLPLSAFYFGKISLLSVFANIICIPLFEIAFIGVFVVTIFASILEFFAVFLIPFKYIMNFITLIASFVASQKSFVVNLGTVNFAWILCFYCGIFVLGNFVNLKKSLKCITCLILIAICIVYGTLVSLPKRFENLTIFQNQNLYHIVVSSTNQKLLISKSTSVPCDFANCCKVSSIDFLVATTTNESEKIEQYFAIEQKSYFGYDTSLGDFDIKYVKLLDKINFVQIKVDGYTIWYMFDTLSQVEEELLQDFPSPNILINCDLTTLTFGDFRLSSTDFWCKNQDVKNNNFGFDIINGKLNKYWSLN